MWMCVSAYEMAYASMYRLPCASEFRSGFPWVSGLPCALEYGLPCGSEYESVCASKYESAYASEYGSVYRSACKSVYKRKFALALWLEYRLPSACKPKFLWELVLSFRSLFLSASP
jgi:hypothetical protein